MSQTPSLQEYPGYFPAAKPPFWNRTKAAFAAGVGGLVIGLLAASGSATDAAEPKQPEAAQAAPVVENSDADVAEAVDSAVSEAVADEHARMQEKLDQQRAAAQDRLATARSRAQAAQQRAVRRAVAHTRAVDRARTARAVATARANALAQIPAQAPASSGGGTDPRFSYCYEANDAGYGPYYQGQDPEYDWYDDADNDGEVCE